MYKFNIYISILFNTTKLSESKILGRFSSIMEYLDVGITVLNSILFVSILDFINNSTRTKYFKNSCKKSIITAKGISIISGENFSVEKEFSKKTIKVTDDSGINLSKQIKIPSTNLNNKVVGTYKISSIR